MSRKLKKAEEFDFWFDNSETYYANTLERKGV